MDLNPNRRLLAALTLATVGQPQAVPRRMDENTPASVCQEFEVLLNGCKQTLCKVADVDRGFVVRYKKGVGSRPSGKATEVVRGKVEIRRKGEARKSGQFDHTAARGTGGDVASQHPGDASAVPCSPADTEAASQG